MPAQPQSLASSTAEFEVRAYAPFSGSAPPAQLALQHALRRSPHTCTAMLLHVLTNPQKDRPETVRKYAAHRDQTEKDVLHDETKVNRAAT